MIFILFINERLVDCQPIKKCLQNLFSLYLPKNTNPFIYMNLSIDPQNLDVNIHPTKHEVRFLYQDEIINRIQSVFEQKLLNSNVSRTFYVKNLTIDTYVGAKSKNKDEEAEKDTNDGEEGSNKKLDDSKIVHPYQLTRVDTKERKLDSYFHSTSGLDESIKSLSKSSKQKEESSSQSISNGEVKSPLRKQNLERTFNFLSLRELREECEKSSSKFLRQVLQDMSFVGCLDRELALVQHQTGLYIMNTHILSYELFYQISLFNFGNFGYFTLSESCSVRDLAMTALDDPETEWSSDDGPKDKLSRRCAKFLHSKSVMLDDYFSIKIRKDNDTGDIFLDALPMLIEDYEPDMVDLPLFIIRLATEVDWENEKECFQSICNEIAQFYSIKNLKYENMELEEQGKKPDHTWFIEHVFYKAFANMLLPSSEREKQINFKLVDLSKLYKVFERC